MVIDVISDIVCPWCFIGKRRLERALAVRPDIEPTVVWRAFQLNPEMPPEGMERSHYLVAKFGSPARAAEIYETIATVGAADGLAFAFERIERTPNTLDGHRLVRFAAEHGRQDALVEILFRRYFEEGVDLGAHANLVAAAADAGLDAGAAERWLASGEGLEAVRIEELQARRLGVAGVPCFVIDRRFAISGAQAPEVFQRVFETARQAAFA